MAKAKKKKYSASDKAILGIGYVLLGAFVLSPFWFRFYML